MVEWKREMSLKPPLVAEKLWRKKNDGSELNKSTKYEFLRSTVKIGKKRNPDFSWQQSEAANGVGWSLIV